MFFDSEFGHDNISRETDYFESGGKEITWIAPDNTQIITIVPNTVYPPSADTNLLAESIFSRGNAGGKRLFEIGVGSGVISTFSAMLGWDVSGCDINPLAVSCTRGLLSENGFTNHSINEGGIGDENVQQWSGEGNYDLLIWNMPYLSVPKPGEPMLGPLEEAGLIDIEKSDSGLLEFLTNRTDFLKSNGKIILICSDNNNGCMLRSRWMSKGWASRIIRSKTMADGEKLMAIELWRPWLGRGLVIIDEVPSTNTELIENGIDMGQHLRAEIQTSGRGRRNSTWDSSKGDLTSSWLIYNGPASNCNFSAGTIQLKAAIAILDAISASTGQQLASEGNDSIQNIAKMGFTLKWPNDIWFENGKLAGVLVESRSFKNHIKIVVGIGVNVENNSANMERDYPKSKLAECQLVNCSIVEFERTLDAALASWFEGDVSLTNLGGLEVKDLAFDSIEEHVLKHGKPLISGKKVELLEINSDGHLNIQLPDSRKTVITESDVLLWPHQSS